MDWVPPRGLRRIVVDPFAVVLGIVAVALAVPLLVVGGLIDLVFRRPFPTARLVAAGLAHVVMEAVGVVCLTVLWLVCLPFGGVRSARATELHARFVRWWLGSLIGATERLLGIRVEIEDRRQPAPGPVLVFSRHAGPWDSFLLAHALVRAYRRRPRIVMKEAMQWSPVIDLVGNRMPNRFIQPRGAGSERFIPQIEALARGMGPHDALVLFPEGGNFTVRRREAGIERLRSEGRLRYASEANEMANLVAPRPGGVLAAMRGAPDADVVFVAHTGLEPLTSLEQLWRSVPLCRPLIGRYWRLRPTEVPEGEAERVDWLFAWWERIDDWIERHHAVERTQVREEPEDPASETGEEPDR